MSSYSDSAPAPAPEPAPAPAEKPKQVKKKMTEKQKEQLANHMAKLKSKKEMSPSDLSRHRMRMMNKMLKGMSVTQAHNAIKKAKDEKAKAKK